MESYHTSRRRRAMRPRAWYIPAVDAFDATGSRELPMRKVFHAPPILLLLTLGPALDGCGGTGVGDADPLGGPVAAVESGSEAIRQGVGQIGDIVTGGIVSGATSRRQLQEAAREHRELAAHLERLERFFRRRKIHLSDDDERALERARAGLADAARALRASGAKAGPDLYRPLDRARGTFNRLAERYGAPPYEGYIAVK